MTFTLRFRPVVFGPPSRPTCVYYLLEESDGRVFFRDLEIAWPLKVSLDAATVDDLPRPYRDEEACAGLLPVQEAVGETPLEAFHGMLAVLRRVSAEGADAVPKREAAPSRQARRAARPSR